MLEGGENRIRRKKESQKSKRKDFRGKEGAHSLVLREMASRAEGS